MFGSFFGRLPTLPRPWGSRTFFQAGCCMGGRRMVAGMVLAGAVSLGWLVAGGGAPFLGVEAIFPGLAITLAVFGFNLFGDAVRDALDPKLRSQ